MAYAGSDVCHGGNGTGQLSRHIGWWEPCAGGWRHGCGILCRQVIGAGGAVCAPKVPAGCQFGERTVLGRVLAET